MKNIVGRRVQEARQKFKPPLSQEALAVRLELEGWKISRGTVSKIEAGIRQVTDFEVMALARTLKVPPEWLLDKQLFESLLNKPKRVFLKWSGKMGEWLNSPKPTRPI